MTSASGRPPTTGTRHNPLAGLPAALTRCERAARGIDLAALQRAGLSSAARPAPLGELYPPRALMHEMSPDELYAGATPVVDLQLEIPLDGSLSPRGDRIATYLQMLAREIAFAAARLPRGIVVRSLRVSGGCASYLRPNQIERLFAQLRASLRVAPGAPLSYELRPSFAREAGAHARLDALHACGVDRLELSLCSLDERVLRQLRRGYTPREVHQLLALLSARGDAFRFGVAVTYGLPYQTLASWYSTLAQLTAAGVDEITPRVLISSAELGSSRQALPDEHARLLMHLMARAALDEPGYRETACGRWQRRDLAPTADETLSHEQHNVLGLGLGAVGYIGDTQYRNVDDLAPYARRLERNVSPLAAGVSLDFDERVRRSAIVSLRGAGICRDEMLERYGFDAPVQLADEVEPLAMLGLIDVERDHLSLTSLGRLYVEDVAARLASPGAREALQRVLPFAARRRHRAPRTDASLRARITATA